MGSKYSFLFIFRKSEGVYVERSEKGRKLVNIHSATPRELTGLIFLVYQLRGGEQQTES